MKKAPKKYQKIIEKFMKSRGYEIVINRYPLSLCYDHEDESYKVVECNVTKEHVEDHGMFKQRALDIINNNDDLFLEIEKEEGETIHFNVDFITLRILPNNRAIVQISRNMLGSKGCPFPF